MPHRSTNDGGPGPYDLYRLPCTLRFNTFFVPPPPGIAGPWERAFPYRRPTPTSHVGHIRHPGRDPRPSFVVRVVRATRTTRAVVRVVRATWATRARCPCRTRNANNSLSSSCRTDNVDNSDQKSVSCVQRGQLEQKSVSYAQRQLQRQLTPRVRRNALVGSRLLYNLIAIPVAPTVETSAP